MSSLAVSGIVFTVIFSGALLGMGLRRLLPHHHLESETKDVVKLAAGLVGTMAALVLGLLTASAKSSFDAQHNLIAQVAANISFCDRALAHYGPEAQGARTGLKQSVTSLVDQLWPDGLAGTARGEPRVGPDLIFEQIQGLPANSDIQRAAQAAALKAVTDVTQARWLLAAQKTSSIQPPFLVVMMFWFAMLFASFSLFSRPNVTAVCALVIGAMSIAGAIFLILEMDHPFSGLIRLSADPLQRVLAQLGR